MTLEPHGADTYVGLSLPTPWGRVYGGQVVAQALRAAIATLPGEYVVHSLHAYFIRGGDLAEPIRYEVDRLRNGRSFATRQVVARQSNGAILNLSASFQREEAGYDLAVARLDHALPEPANAPDDDPWSALFERRDAAGAVAGRSAAWLRIREPLGDDPVLHACGLAFLSDDTPMEASRSLHPRWEPGNYEVFSDASLDHSMWFHRPMRADAWQQHDFRGQGLVGVRGLSLGHIHDQSGSHVATVAQEVLLRVSRDA